MDKVIIKNKKTKKRFQQPFKFEKDYNSGRGSNQTMDNREVEDYHIQEQFIDTRLSNKTNGRHSRQL